MQKDGMISIKYGKATIVCKPEDMAGILASLGSVIAGVPTKPVYEKSSIVRKAMKNIIADNSEDLVMNALKGRAGLHVVFSGLNEEIRERFGEEPTDVTGGLINKGLIEGRSVKGGFYITLPIKK